MTLNDLMTRHGPGPRSDQTFPEGPTARERVRRAAPAVPLRSELDPEPAQ